MKKTGTFLIVIGLLIFGYIGYEQIQTKIIEQKVFAQMDDVSKSLQQGIKQTTNTPTAEEKSKTGDNTGLELIISKIDLQVPVLEGTSREILRVAVGHLEESGELGKINNNFVVLGHRAYIAGRFFNRLDELEKRDIILFKENGETMEYHVTGRKIINPDQLEVLLPKKGKSIVTLITCHPMYSSKQRLVVTAEKAE